jgi:hypothetical protein
VALSGKVPARPAGKHRLIPKRLDRTIVERALKWGATAADRPQPAVFAGASLLFCINRSMTEARNLQFKCETVCLVLQLFYSATVRADVFVLYREAQNPIKGTLL